MSFRYLLENREGLATFEDSSDDSCILVKVEQPRSNGLLDSPDVHNTSFLLNIQVCR